MTDLASRLQTIEDRFAILDLEADYAAHWDFGRASDWAALYTEDGYFDMLPTATTAAFKATGHAELATFCNHISQTWQGLHFMHPPRLKLNGDTASALIFFEFRHVMNSGSGHTRQGVTAGYYEVDYRRTADGWRIAGRREQAVFDDTQQSFAFRRDGLE